MCNFLFSFLKLIRLLRYYENNAIRPTIRITLGNLLTWLAGWESDITLYMTANGLGEINYAIKLIDLEPRRATVGLLVNTIRDSMQSIDSVLTTFNSQV